MDELRDGMMKADDLSDTIYHSVNSPNNCVTEEITIRRTAGDF